MLSPQMHEVVIRLLESSEANLMAARVILEDHAPQEKGSCQHEPHNVRVVQTFGAELRLCNACGDLVGEENVNP